MLILLNENNTLNKAAKQKKIIKYETISFVQNVK